MKDKLVKQISVKNGAVSVRESENDDYFVVGYSDVLAVIGMDHAFEIKGSESEGDEEIVWKDGIYEMHPECHFTYTVVNNKAYIYN